MDLGYCDLAYFSKAALKGTAWSAEIWQMGKLRQGRGI